MCVCVGGGGFDVREGLTCDFTVTASGAKTSAIILRTITVAKQFYGLLMLALHVIIPYYLARIRAPSEPTFYTFVAVLCTNFCYLFQKYLDINILLCSFVCSMGSDFGGDYTLNLCRFLLPFLHANICEYDIYGGGVYYRKLVVRCW